MTRFEILKFLHVMGAVIWVGGAFVVVVLTAMSKRAPVDYRIGFADAIRKATAVFDLSSLMVLGFGIWLVIDVGPYRFDQAWIIIGIAGVALSIVLGLAFIGPNDAKMIASYEAGDTATGDARLERGLKVAGLYVAYLVFVVWAMVTKPGL